MKCSCQQDELYAAEAGVPHGAHIAPADVQGWVDALRDLPLWDRQYPQVLRVEAHVRRTDRDGSCGGWFPDDGCGQIEMAPVHLNELILCHEVAHVLAAARYGSGAHDPWFARTYLELVGSAVPHLFSDLYAAFVKAGIDHDHQSSVPAGIEMGGGS